MPKLELRWIGEIPKICDICGTKLKKEFVDGRTFSGCWAIMCKGCFKLNGIGLGIGKGQKYLFPEGIKIKKSCEGCRALGTDLGSDELECVLGYKTKEEVLMDVVVCLIPLEQCPKPRTYDGYYLQMKLKVKEE